MRLKFIAAAAFALLLGGWQASASQVGPGETFQDAVTLYERGLYAEAKSIFEDLSRQEPDVMADGYIVLCALQTKAAGYDALVADYESRYINSTLTPEINYVYGNILFDEGSYQEAARRFESVPDISLDRRERT